MLYCWPKLKFSVLHGVDAGVAEGGRRLGGGGSSVLYIKKIGGSIVVYILPHLERGCWRTADFCFLHPGLVMHAGGETHACMIAFEIQLVSSYVFVVARERTQSCCVPTGLLVLNGWEAGKGWG